MKKRIYAGAGVSAVIAVIALTATVSGAIATSSAKPLPASSCSAIQNSGGKYLIASDLPLQGSGRTQTSQMTRAIKFVFASHGWKAGKYSIAYQSCDDSTAQAGKWDSGKAAANAQAYAQNSDVVGVIGTFNSGAAEIEIPVLNRAPNGPVAMVSPANTYVGLTHGGPGTAAGEPGKYYPTGKRNYARVVAADDYQGAADALLAKSLGVKKVFVLNDKEAYGLGVATNFKNAATKLGIKVVGFTAWDGKASSYEALAVKIQASGAQGVFLGGLICENGGKLIKDVRNGAKSVKIIAPDGFTPVSATVQEAGAAAEGMLVSVAGLPNSALKGAGKTFVSKFTKADKRPPDPYSVYAAQAAEALVAALAQSNGSRSDVAKQLFKIKLTNSILGTLSFNSNGDVTANPVTIYKVASGKSTTLKVIVPPNSLVKSA
ncbi:MAG: branched-chain amino acid ABC transporter substrate-binding protein [Actinobacteria bacterium]|nr:branched-chain amino acid ABC transporter substrate-binding protein [Actinomycetota bacterium]